MKLSLNAFRGATQPLDVKFNTNHNITILYGENGCGKTTISDALEFVVNGTTGSLEEKHIDGKSRTNHLVNANCDKKDLKVSLTLQNKTRTAKLSGAKVEHSGELDYSLKVLSRRYITQLVEAKPADRFKRVQDFVSLPALEREEDALQKLVQTEKRNLETQADKILQAEEILKELFTEHADQDIFADKPKEWQKHILGEYEEGTAKYLATLKAIDQELRRLRADYKSLEDAFPEMEKKTEQSEVETKVMTNLLAEHSDELSNAFETLQSAQGFFTKTETDHCPVCDSKIGHAPLIEKVDKKLETLKAVKEQVKKLKTAQDNLTAIQTRQKTLQGTFFSIIVALRESHESAKKLKKWELPDLPTPLLSVQSSKDLNAEWFKELNAQAEQLTELLELVEEELKALQNIQSLQNQVRQALERIKQAKEDYKRIQFAAERGETIRKILHRERINHANETLKAISGDFAHLYQTIHPGEKLENIRLYLHPTKKSSAQFDGEIFGREDANPVACLSESHLDTLGLCLILALEKREAPESTILYLDDAIASVDEAHMERLYELLLAQAENFHHVIISSHYQPLRFKFRWGILTQQKVEFMELGAWSLKRGIQLAKGPNSEIALLRRYISEAEDASTIAAKSGLILERTLDFLTGIYQCRMPRNPGAEQRWTLDHYKGGLKAEKKLMPALKAAHIDDEGTVTAEFELAPLLEDIFSRLQFRNAIGCHFKELAGYFDEIDEALELGKATIALVDALCDENDALPDSKKDALSWQNKGGKVTRRLYPLLKPE
jgi:energy-coupling factor transporter ATP-binding protein EcfA2